MVNCFISHKLKLVALLQTSEFRAEIPRSQNRNLQYTTTLAKIYEKDLFNIYIFQFISNY
jgi:hypothetical protein